MDRASITAELRAYVRRYREQHRTKTAWRTPLVGFAAAADPLFARLKRAVSPSHLLPSQLLRTVRTVVAFFVPFHRSIGCSNIAGVPASEQWARAYIETNRLIEAVGLHMKTYLETEGYQAVATPPTHNFDPERLISDWSHRHVAYIAGLGGFGLNNMLITESGRCGRLGSLLISLELPPDERPREESCLHRYDGSCIACASRCVNQALFVDRFDRHRCYAMCLENDRRYRALGTADVCGKCLVGVPCSFTNPVRKRKQTST